MQRSWRKLFAAPTRFTLWFRLIPVLPIIAPSKIAKVKRSRKRSSICRRAKQHGRGFKRRDRCDRGVARAGGTPEKDRQYQFAPSSARLILRQLLLIDVFD